jgi:hypothetical protein
MSKCPPEEVYHARGTCPSLRRYLIQAIPLCFMGVQGLLYGLHKVRVRGVLVGHSPGAHQGNRGHLPKLPRAYVLQLCCLTTLQKRLDRRRARTTAAPLARSSVGPLAPARRRRFDTRALLDSYSGICIIALYFLCACLSPLPRRRRQEQLHGIRFCDAVGVLACVVHAPCCTLLCLAALGRLFDTVGSLYVCRLHGNQASRVRV